jgi:type VI secretion system protein ImpJ
VTPKKPVFWHQGLFLQPQHFQLSDQYHLSMLGEVLAFGLPYFRGVTQLDIREEALAAKRFEVSALHVVFANGSMCAYPGNALLGARSFDEAWVAADKPFTIYLGLHKWNQTGENVTVSADLDEAAKAQTAYVATADPESVPDQYGQGPEAMVRRMFHVLHLFFENEIDGLDAYHLMPLAQLVRDGDKIRLSPKFSPPCLTIEGSKEIYKILKDLADQIVSRARSLENYKMGAEVSTHDFDPSYIIFLQALLTLNRYAPLLAHYVESVNVNPWTVYGSLRQFIGELSTFSENLSATGESYDGSKLLPAYDHDDPWPCFEAARSLIEQMIEGIGTRIELLVRLTLKDGYYSAEIPARVFTPQNRFWLSIHAEADMNTTLGQVLSSAKLCATPLMSTLLIKAVPGVPITYHKTPPAGLPKRAGTLYFQIDVKSALWADVVRNGSISMFWDSPPEGMAASIAVLRGQ